MNLGIALLLALLTFICFMTHKPYWMTFKAQQNIHENAVYLLFILYQCYAIWLVFGVSSFHLQQCLHYVGHWFHQLLYNFHLSMFHSYCNFFQRSFLLVVRSLRSQRHQSTLFQRYLIGFMSGACGFHNVIVWSLNHLIVDLLVCFGSLSCWHTHSTTFFFKPSQLTCSGCHVWCYDNACHSFSLWLWWAPNALLIHSTPNHDAPSFMLHILTNHVIVAGFRRPLPTPLSTIIPPQYWTTFIWEYDFPLLLLPPILVLFCPFMN